MASEVGFEVVTSNGLGGRIEVTALNDLKWGCWSMKNWLSFKLGKITIFCNFWPRMASEVGSEVTRGRWAAFDLSHDLKKRFLPWIYDTPKSVNQLTASEAVEAGLTWPKTTAPMSWGYMPSFKLLGQSKRSGSLDKLSCFPSKYYYILHILQISWQIWIWSKEAVISDIQTAYMSWAGYRISSFKYYYRFRGRIGFEVKIPIF